MTDSDVKPALKRGHYAVDVDLPSVTETPKRSELSQESTVVWHQRAVDKQTPNDAKSDIEYCTKCWC